MHDEFLDKLAQGDERAWAEAYTPLFGEVRKVLKARLLPGMGIDPEDKAAEIIAGEIMPALRDRRESFAKLANFQELLRLARTIAARRAVDVIRKVKRRGEESLPEGYEGLLGGGAAIAEMGLGGEQATEGFVLLVNALKPPKPDLFLDYFAAGLTYAEIGEKHDMPLGTVCSHFRRGLNELKGILGDPESQLEGSPS